MVEPQINLKLLQVLTKFCPNLSSQKIKRLEHWAIKNLEPWNRKWEDLSLFSLIWFSISLLL